MGVIKKDAVGAKPPENTSTQLVNCSSFEQGDLVQSVDDGRYGTVIQTNFGGKATQVYVQWITGGTSEANSLHLRRA